MRAEAEGRAMEDRSLLDHDSMGHSVCLAAALHAPRGAACDDFFTNSERKRSWQNPLAIQDAGSGHDEVL
jgi:hypothetical protein